MEECKFKRGDRILVRDDKDHEWEEREFLTYIEGLERPYMARSSAEQKVAVPWRYVKAISEDTETDSLTVQDLIREYQNKPLWKEFVDEEIKDIREIVAVLGIYGILNMFEEWLKDGRYIVDREPK